jgi:hypothetical protein
MSAFWAFPLAGTKSFFPKLFVTIFGVANGTVIDLGT